MVGVLYVGALPRDGSFERSRPSAPPSFSNTWHVVQATFPSSERMVSAKRRSPSVTRAGSRSVRGSIGSNGFSRVAHFLGIGAVAGVLALGVPHPASVESTQAMATIFARIAVLLWA